MCRPEEAPVTYGSPEAVNGLPSVSPYTELRYPMRRDFVE